MRDSGSETRQESNSGCLQEVIDSVRPSENP